jgi:signal transduction histidine kinase
MARVNANESLRDTLYSLQSRAERLIATGRLVLATGALLAIWLDPTQPSHASHLTYAMLIGYAAYAAVLGLLAWQADTVLVRTRLLTHVIDFLLFSGFMYLTEAPTSPFFVYFVFSLVAATLRWQWRGTAWTAVVALAVFLGMGLWGGKVWSDPAFELDRFLIRSIYLAVIAVLVGYLGVYEQRLRRELTALAAWPHTVSPDARPLVHDLLAYAASILNAPRVLLAWEEPEEPWLYLALWSREPFLWTREPPMTFTPLVADSLAMTCFLCPDVRTSLPTVFQTPNRGFQRWHGTPLHPDLQARFALGAVLCCPVQGTNLTGHVLFLDQPEMTVDALALGTVVTREVVTRLDQFLLAQQQQQAAATEARLDLARDLHDGLLQSLTVAAVHVETVRRLLARDPHEAAARLHDIQQLLAAEQRDLRGFVQELKTTPLSPVSTATDLPMRLTTLGERITRHWGVRVEMTIEPCVTAVPESLAQACYRLVHEALINAARHARASAVRVECRAEEHHLCLTIADDGCGFPFRGCYDLATLTVLNIGPATIKERLASLGGSLLLDSTTTGTRLHMTLPLTYPGGSYVDSPDCG